MTLARLGFNIPSFTYPGTGDADLFDTVCATAAAAADAARLGAGWSARAPARKNMRGQVNLLGSRRGSAGD